MDRIFAAIALIVFAAFLAVPLFKLEAIDLTIVLIIAVLMAAWDLWLSNKPKRRGR